MVEAPLRRKAVSVLQCGGFEMPRSRRIVVALPDGTELFKVGPQPDGRINIYLPGKWHLSGFYTGLAKDTNIILTPDGPTQP
jgi:hypothetical protein